MRSELGENGCPFHGFLFVGLIHGFQFRTGQCVRRVDSYLTCDGPYNGVVVSGKHLDLYTVFMQLLYGLCCRLFGGIEESQEPDQHHVVFVFDGKTVFLVGITSLSYGQNPHALKIHLAACLDGFFLEFGSHGANFSVIFGISTDFQHFFQSSFGNDLPLSLLVFHYDRHSPAGEIERNFVNLAVIILQIFQLQFFDV